MEEILERRQEEVNALIEPFNKTEIGKLRVRFFQKNINESEFDWYSVLGINKYLGDYYFKKYAIKNYNLIDYLDVLSRKVGNPLDLLKLFHDDKYDFLIDATLIRSFFDKTSKKTTDYDLKFLKDNQDIKEFHQVLQESLITIQCERYSKKFLRDYFLNSEVFSLEFNINNKESVEMKSPDYRDISTLSMGQKVVAILSFLLSYSDYSDDYSPFIVDQPEDNLDNQYIYKNLVTDLRKLKFKRQIIFATHNSTVVMNSGTEQVIVTGSDNRNGWCETSGYSSNPKIVNHVLSILEGGKKAFSDKFFLYREKLTISSSDVFSEELQHSNEKEEYLEIVLKLLEYLENSDDSEKDEVIFKEISKLIGKEE